MTNYFVIGCLVISHSFGLFLLAFLSEDFAEDSEDEDESEDDESEDDDSELLLSLELSFSALAFSLYSLLR